MARIEMHAHAIQLIGVILDKTQASAHFLIAGELLFYYENVCLSFCLSVCPRPLFVKLF